MDGPKNPTTEKAPSKSVGDNTTKQIPQIKEESHEHERTSMKTTKPDAAHTKNERPITEEHRMIEREASQKIGEIEEFSGLRSAKYFSMKALPEVKDEVRTPDSAASGTETKHIPSDTSIKKPDVTPEQICIPPADPSKKSTPMEHVAKVREKPNTSQEETIEQGSNPINEASNKSIKADIEVHNSRREFDEERRKTVIGINTSSVFEKEKVFDSVVDVPKEEAANMKFTSNFVRTTHGRQFNNKPIPRTLDSREIRTKVLNTYTKNHDFIMDEYYEDRVIKNKDISISCDIETQELITIESKYTKYYNQVHNLQIKRDSYLSSLQAVFLNYVNRFTMK